MSVSGPRTKFASLVQTSSCFIYLFWQTETDEACDFSFSIFLNKTYKRDKDLSDCTGIYGKLRIIEGLQCRHVWSLAWWFIRTLLSTYIAFFHPSWLVFVCHWHHRFNILIKNSAVRRKLLICISYYEAKVGKGHQNLKLIVIRPIYEMEHYRLLSKSNPISEKCGKNLSKLVVKKLHSCKPFHYHEAIIFDA